MQQTALPELDREYQDYLNRGGDRSITMRDFAMFKDSQEGTQRRQGAYTVKPNPSVLQQLNQFVGPVNEGLNFLSKEIANMPTAANVGPGGMVPQSQADFDRMLEQNQKYWTGQVPETSAAGFAGQVTKGLGSLVGLNPETSQQVGQEMAQGAPRMLATMVNPELMAVDQAAQAYSRSVESGASTPSIVAQTALGALMPKMFHVGGAVGQEAAAQTAAKLGIQNPVTQQLTEFLGNQAGMFAAGLAHQEGMGIAATGAPTDVLTPENLFAQVVNQVPWTPKGVADVIAPPEITRTGVIQARTAGIKEGETQWGSEMGKKVTNLIGERTKPDYEQKVRSFVDTLTPEEYEQLSPLHAMYPQMPAGAPNKAAVAEFRAILGQRESEQRAAANESPEMKDLYRQYDEAFTANPDDRGTLAKIVEKMDALRKPSQPAFSLLDPSQGLDLSDPQKLDSKVVLDQILSGRLVPTGVPGNEANIQFVRDLQRTLLKEVPGQQRFARNYDKEQQLLRLGALVDASGPTNLSKEAAEQWQKLSNDEKTMAMKLIKVWKNPAAELKLGSSAPLVPDNWTFTKLPPIDQQLETIRQKAYDAERTGTRDFSPIESPADFGQLVKSGNEYVDSVIDFVNRAGWGHKQIFEEYGKPLRRLDEETLGRMFNEELVRSGSQLASISRVVEAVKAQIHYARSIAEGIVQKGAFSEDFTKRNQQDMAKDTDFMSKVQNFPKWVQDIVGLHYNKASEYFDKNGRRNWRLDNFRDEVGQALASVDPASLPKFGSEAFSFDPNEYQGLMRRRSQLRDTSKQRGDAMDEGKDFEDIAKKGQETEDEEAFKQTASAREDTTEETSAPESFSSADFDKLRQYSAYLEDAKSALEKVRVNYGKESKTIGDNLWNVLTKEHTPTDVSSASERTEGEKGVGGLDAETLDAASEVDLKKDSEVAAERKSIGEDVAEKYFNKVGEANDPQEALKKLTTDQFAVIYSKVFPGFNAKMSKVSKGDIGASYKVGARDNSAATSQMLREVLDADMQADVEKGAGEQRQITEAQKAVIEKVTGKTYAQWKADGGKNWNQFFLNTFGSGNRQATMAGAETLKLLLGGYELKPGVTLEEVRKEYSQKIAKKGPDMVFDVGQALRREAYKRGLSPQWVDSMLPTLERLVKPFAEMTQPSFAQITDPKKAFQAAVDRATILGAYVPTHAIVGGKAMRDPVIGLHLQNLFDKFGHEAMARYYITTTLSHELLHAFVEQVVKKPEAGWSAHVKMQVKEYLNLINRVNEMGTEDRVAFATSILDTMNPPEFIREVGPDGLSRLNKDTQAIVRAVVHDPEEMAAFIYQHATAGMLMDAGGKSAANAIAATREKMLWLDDDVREFVRGQWRNLNDFAGVIQDVINDKTYRASRKMTTKVGIEQAPDRKEGMLRGEVEATPTAKGKAEIVNPSAPTGLGDVQRVLDSEAGRTPGPEAVETAAQSFADRRQAEEAIQAASKLGKMNEGQQPLEGTPNSPITHYGVLRELVKLDKRLVAVQAQLDRIQSFYGSDSSIKEAATDQGIRTISAAELGDAQMSRLMGDVPLGPKKKSDDAVNLAAKWLGQGDGTDKKFTQGVMMRYLALMPQRLQAAAREGFAAANDVVNTLNWQPLATKLIDSAFGPVTKRTASGELKFDEESPFRRLFQAKVDSDLAGARKAANDIIRELQVPDANAENPKDNGLDSPEGQKIVAKHLMSVPKEQRPVVIEAVRTIFNIHKDVLAKTVLTQRSTQAGILGQFLMASNEGKLDARTAETLGFQILNHALEGSSAATPEAQAAWKQKTAELGTQLTNMGLEPSSLAKALEVASAGIGTIKKQEALLRSPTQFASEQRFGRYMVVWTDKEGARHNFGFENDTDAKYFVRDLAAKGATNIKAEDTYKWSDQARMAYDYIMLNGVDQELTQAFQKQLELVASLKSPFDDPNQPSIGQRAADIIKQNFNPLSIIYEHSSLNQLDKNWMKREYKPGREYIDYFANTVNYVNKTSLAMARQASRNKIALQTLELRQKGASQLADDVLKHFNETVSPESPTTRTWRAFVASMSLAGNIPNAMLEVFQPVQSGLEVLTRQTNSTKSAATALANAAAKLTSYRLNDNFTKVTDAADRKVRLGHEMEKDEEIAYHYRRMLDEGRLTGKLYLEDLDNTVHNINIAKPRVGDMDVVDRAKVLTDSTIGTMVHALEVASVAREKMTGWNQRLTAYGALEAGYEMGLRGDKLFSFAAGLVPSMNLIGGRYIRPYGATMLTHGNPVWRNVFGSFYVMQNYAIGFTNQMIKDAYDGFVPHESRLRPEQRAAARQAFAQGMAVTVALAGVGGLPLVRAAFALIQKLTGKDPEAALREGLYQAGVATTGDRAIGQAMSDLAMTGAVNRFSGVDFASRAGVESIFGLSPDEGFSLSDLAGPTGNMMANVVAATQLVAHGAPMKAALRVAPTGLRGALRTAQSLYNYGDMRTVDASGNLITKPEGIQKLGYVLGFGTAEQAKMQREAQLVHRGEEWASDQRKLEYNGYAQELLKGNSWAVMQKAYQNQLNPDFNPREFIESVVDRAIDMQLPRDAQRSGALQTSPGRAAIGQTFDNPRTSEVQRLMLKQQMLAQIGYPFGMQPASQKEYIKASLIDQLVQLRGFTRQEAEQIVSRQLAL